MGWMMMVNGVDEVDDDGNGVNGVDGVDDDGNGANGADDIYNNV
ncbi:hypothetical protein PRLR6014_28680 [Prevotella lacticifex]|nr:hypothetical protein PRLR6014_28680 [Prevotella lacticifex]